MTNLFFVFLLQTYFPKSSHLNQQFHFFIFSDQNSWSVLISLFYFIHPQQILSPLPPKYYNRNLVVSYHLHFYHSGPATITIPRISLSLLPGLHASTLCCHLSTLPPIFAQHNSHSEPLKQVRTCHLSALSSPLTSNIIQIKTKVLPETCRYEPHIIFPRHMTDLILDSLPLAHWPLFAPTCQACSWLPKYPPNLLPLPVHSENFVSTSLRSRPLTSLNVTTPLSQSGTLNPFACLTVLHMFHTT